MISVVGPSGASPGQVVCFTVTGAIGSLGVSARFLGRPMPVTITGLGNGVFVVCIKTIPSEEGILSVFVYDDSDAFAFGLTPVTR